MIHKRGDKEANSKPRVIVIDSCLDCPYAKNKYNSFCMSFGFDCELLDESFVFDDNAMHFTVLEKCPLEREDTND